MARTLVRSVPRCLSPAYTIFLDTTVASLVVTPPLHQGIAFNAAPIWLFLASHFFAQSSEKPVVVYLVSYREAQVVPPVGFGS